jgi:hypothetical protein
MFVQVRSLGGMNYVKPETVIAITMSDPTKCTIFLEGGVSISCNEPAKDAYEKIMQALGQAPAEKKA